MRQRHGRAAVADVRPRSGRIRLSTMRLRRALALEHGRVLLDVRRERLRELAPRLATVTQAHEPGHAEEEVEQRETRGKANGENDVRVYGWHGCGVDGASVPAVTDEWVDYLSRRETCGPKGERRFAGLAHL